MNKPSNIEIIQTMYVAFGRGDIAAILPHLHDDVDWQINVDPNAPGVAAVPMFRSRRGRAAVGEFFGLLGSAIEFHSFQPLSFLSGGNEVAVRVELEFTVRSTGRGGKMQAMHHFTLDDSGKVTRFIDFLDTLADAAAWDVVRAK